MNQIVVARYGEIHLKGNNRPMFINALLRNLRKKINAKIEHIDARIHISNFEQSGMNAGEIAAMAAGVFGVVSASVVAIVKTDEFEITKQVLSREVAVTFKVVVNRSDKTFPHKSQPFAAKLGEQILKRNPHAAVDVHNPSTTINVDIRRSHTFVYSDTIKGVGGLPVGTSGRAVVLLSGGIDSPVAAYLAAKRGLKLDFLHFASPPHTSELALEKVSKLRDVLSNYVGEPQLLVVPFTSLLETLRDKCSAEYTITLMRRFMIRVAAALGYDCIITGENLAQVASQTIQGIASNNYLAGTTPILRPLVTFDKSEIISIAQDIKTYPISILDYADCCTVFVPKNPSIKPQIEKLDTQEKRLYVDALVKFCVENIYQYQA